MANTNKPTPELTKSTKKIYEALREKGFKIDSSVAIIVKNDPKEYRVSQNYMSTGIGFQVDELDLNELEQDGIHIWRTWTFKG